MLFVSSAMSVLEVKFIGDGDVLEHIVDKQEGMDALLRVSLSEYFCVSLTFCSLT